MTAAARDLIDGRGPPNPPRWPDGRPYDKGLQGVWNRRIEEAHWLEEEDDFFTDEDRAALAHAIQMLQELKRAFGTHGQDAVDL